MKIFSYQACSNASGFYLCSMGTRLIIGIDDTDNLHSRGTGYLARQLGLGLEQSGICRLQNIVRHQLLVSPLIPYTSHNSSASLLVEEVSNTSDVIDYCRKMLLKSCAEGSDVGLCVAEYDTIGTSVIEWGNNAKTIVLVAEEAHRLASDTAIYLEGLTGTKGGVIGSLAAVGLRRAGNDGRLLWMPNLREARGYFSIPELSRTLAVDRILTTGWEEIPDNAVIHLTEWTRPVLRNNEIVLVVTQNTDNETSDFTSAPKEFIKSISE